MRCTPLKSSNPNDENIIMHQVKAFEQYIDLKNEHLGDMNEVYVNENAFSKILSSLRSNGTFIWI